MCLPRGTKGYAEAESSLRARDGRNRRPGIRSRRFDTIAGRIGEMKSLVIGDFDLPFEVASRQAEALQQF